MRLVKLDGLRGVFSLMVVLLHYVNHVPKYFFDNFIIRSSYAFVDFFFVLSGFVIALNYHEIGSYKKLKTFMIKRFIRLYPLLFFTTLMFLFFVLAVILIVDSFPEYQYIAEGYCHFDIECLPIMFWETILMTNSTPILGTATGLNTPSWSISSEMISYLIFGLTIFFIPKKSRNVFILITIIFGAIFLGFRMSYFASVDYGFVRGLVSFNTGYFVWYLSRKEFKIHNFFEFVIPVVTVVIFYFLNKFNHFSPQSQTLGLFTVPIFFGIAILVFLKTNGFLSRVLETKPFQFLGVISFSVYLNHKLLLLIIPTAVFSILKIPENDITQLTVLLFAVAVVILYSYFTYVVIERKCGKKLRTLFKI